MAEEKSSTAQKLIGAGVGILIGLAIGWLIKAIFPLIMLAFAIGGGYAGYKIAKRREEG